VRRHPPDGANGGYRSPGAGPVFRPV